MPAKFYKDVPPGYTVCLHGDCARASCCLHQIAYQRLLESENVLSLLNPARCTKDDQCPYFRDSAPVTYALGFTGMQRRMYPSQYTAFVSILMGRYGRNPYYDRRKGNIALSPVEQQFIRDALRKVGVTEDLEFDRYETGLLWNG